jgi:hypothetical protein
MSNAIVPAGFGNVSTRFANVKRENDLAAGVQTGFGHIGYKGKAWSIRYRGDDKVLMRPDGDGQANSIELVILKSSAAVSKIWYESGYVEGSTAAPDCFSTNGVVPDAASTKKQCTTCAACPKNAWGSRITPQGKPGKACSDSKRLAVVPLGDIKNEVYGGPMLLRVPAASLQDLASFGSKMDQLGFPYYAFGTRIAFDVNQAYPKFVFSAIRELNDAEADLVLAMRESPEVTRILAEGSEVTTGGNPQAGRQQQLAAAFEQPPQGQAIGTPAPTPAQQVVAAPQPTPIVAQPAPTPMVQAAPSVVPSSDGSDPAKFEADLDSALDNLLPG